MADVKDEKPKEEKILKPKMVNDFSNNIEEKPKENFFSKLLGKGKEKTKKETAPKKDDGVSKEDIEKSFDEIMELYPKELDRINYESENNK